MENNNQNAIADINQTVMIDAPIDMVWEKVSTAEGIESWLMPNDFKPEIGYEFHLQSPFGPSPCKVTEIEPPNSLTFNWDTDGWFVVFRLTEVGDKTEFTLTHGGWKQEDAIVPKAKEDAAVVRERMNEGWKQILETLRGSLEG